MERALMDYLLSQQPQQGNMEQPQGQAPYNPFNSGIRNAIESARHSLDMTDKQKDKALRRSMLTFADNMAQQPRQKGFLANFGAAAQAMSPALMAYDDEETRSLEENNAFANQLLAHQAAEQQRQALDEQTKWQRDFSERQLGESTRSHNLLEGFRRDQLKSKNNEGIVEFQGQPFRKLDKVEQREANDLARATSNNSLALQGIEKIYTELEKKTKDNLFQPLGGFSKFANPIKDATGELLGIGDLQKETAIREALGSELGKLNVSLEAAKAGGGKLGQGMYDRLKVFFPNLKDDGLLTIKRKLEQLVTEGKKYDLAAQLSSQYGVNINPADVEKLNLTPEQRSNFSPSPSQDNQAPQAHGEKVVMMDPDTGEKRRVSVEDVTEALKRGLIEVQ